MLAGLHVAAMASACSPVKPSAPRPSAAATSAVATGAAFNPVLANSEVVVGRNRFALGLIGESNRPITDAQVRFGFFQIAGQQATKRGDAVAIFRRLDIEERGMYTAQTAFDEPGLWGVEVKAARPGQEERVGRLSFEVVANGAALMIGDHAPRTKTATVRELSAGELCTSAPPCDLHGVSLDEALGRGRPAVIYFASPGFCMTGTCAPTLGVVREAVAVHGESATFVHVEAYKDPRNQVLADAVHEWGLPSEPWIFLIDRHGVVAERFEGIVTRIELSEAVLALG